MNTGDAPFSAAAVAQEYFAHARQQGVVFEARMTRPVPGSDRWEGGLSRKGAPDLIPAEVIAGWIEDWLRLQSRTLSKYQLVDVVQQLSVIASETTGPTLQG